MPSWGSFDFSEFEKMAKSFESQYEEVSQQMLINILYEVGNRTLRKTKKRTPVGDYGTYTYTYKTGKNKGKMVVKRRKSSTGMVGGNLRRNWRITNVKKVGNVFEIEIYNPTEYAPFVEYGHRKVNNKGWVEGQFMLTVSVKEVEALFPKIADKHVKIALRRLMDD